MKASKRLVYAISIISAAAVFVINHTPRMAGVREFPPAVFSENESGLEARLTEYGAVTAGASLDESLAGRRAVVWSVFGIPIKTVPVYVSERPTLDPSGETVGISIFTEGVLVVGVDGFTAVDGKKLSPAQNAGILPGDVILSIDGRSVSSSAELSGFVSSADPVKLTVERNGKRRIVTVTPAMDAGGAYRLGTWVRDSTSGIGTLTFFDETSRTFAALGHPVIDMDTGSLLKVRDGVLKKAEVIGVTKGAQGAPGELHGTFGSQSAVLGTIEHNSDLGIYGRLSEEALGSLSKLQISAAFPDEVNLGGAVIISSASGKPEYYSCRVIKAAKQAYPAPKGLVIEITDERLIDLTGGIVQGMSGSPIIQDGKLIGAVTHVFVNDPKKGYGAYAYWMYNDISG